METAKANGLEPYWYLKFLFENLPEAMTEDEFKALMPQNVDKNLLENYTTPR
nr:transposase domain-containing protein [Desulfobacter postgatei]